MSDCVICARPLGSDSMWMFHGLCQCPACLALCFGPPECYERAVDWRERYLALQASLPSPDTSKAIAARLAREWRLHDDHEGELQAELHAYASQVCASVEGQLEALREAVRAWAEAQDAEEGEAVAGAELRKKVGR